MNDAGKHHAYPDAVRFEVAEADLAAYHRAADYLNMSDVGVVSVQHEYGIFGGDSGAYVLALLRDLRMPIVTTLHTILATPNRTQRAVMDELCALSERLVVMSQNGVELLHEVHGVPREKIDLIPHGIPALPDAAQSRSKLAMESRNVLLTFGLLSPDKGIELVIDALPMIRKRYPNVVYVVLGATHPHVKERQGEAYRLMLSARAARLGVEDNIVFLDRFVSTAELTQFLAAADIYITPYLNAEQITSGTLAYAVGSGKAVLSSPYRYASELLSEGRGVLVPWRDANAIATEVIDLLGNDERRHALQARALAFGRAMQWPLVAQAYMQSFAKAGETHHARAASARRNSKRRVALPEVNLAHLRAMTDDTGMLQHAAWSVPRYEDGYCVDDNARALLLTSVLEQARIEPAHATRALHTRYLAFVRHAFDPEFGRFRNFLSYARHWADELGSEDSHGRAVWALGTVVGRSHDRGMRGLAYELLQSALPATLTFTSPRAWAYTLLGLYESAHAHEGGDAVHPLVITLAQRLLDVYQRTATADWPWFEESLTYCNARLPQALMVAGEMLHNDAMKRAGIDSLTWLAMTQRNAEGLFAPIGSNGFFVRGGTKSAFDQQPVEACGMVAACLQALAQTGDTVWATRARCAFDWFLGQNELGQWLFDAGTGGCRDGLHPERPNENQGAESTLSFLMALLDMRLIDQPIDARPLLRLEEPPKANGQPHIEAHS
jgi:glycosyltransferase involved in cell wall biosynthesis